MGTYLISVCLYHWNGERASMCV